MVFMKKIIKKIILYLTALVALLPILLFLGRPLLVVDEKPKKADVIIVLSGDSGRLEKAAALYKEGYASYVMLSRANGKGVNIQKAVELGIPEDRIIPEDKATSTYTNALYSKSLMEKYDFSSAIVVSSDYHMKRTKMTFESVFKDTDIDLTYVASQRSENAWFLDDKNIKYTLREYIKLLGYLMKLD